MQIGEDQSSAALQHSVHFARVGFPVREVALIQIRDGKVETPVLEKTEILNVGDVIFIARARQLAGEQHAAEPALATAAIDYFRPRDLAARLQHRLVQKSGAGRISALAAFRDPGRRQLNPLLVEVTRASISTIIDSKIHVNWPKHFDGKRFYNPEGQPARGLRDVFRWKRTSKPEPSPEWVDDIHPSAPPSRVEGALRVTLVNHSTVLLQQAGCNLLTDPIWSERASPVSWTGPRRHRRPGVALENLPPIDVLLISHNHYDHLDRWTLRQLASRVQACVAPLGLAAILRAHGIAVVHELDWGESVKLAEVKIHSVPAAHFSGRGLFDRNRTLWCGYMIESRHGLAYFAADTAFGSHFAAIRERFGAPRLALLPIGAYEPRWMMQGVHMNPEEAAEAHAILEAGTSLAIHHGTFQLGDEAIDTPAKRIAELGLGERFLVLKNGQSADFE